MRPSPNHVGDRLLGRPESDGTSHATTNGVSALQIQPPCPAIERDDRDPNHFGTGAGCRFHPLEQACPDRWASARCQSDG